MPELIGIYDGGRTTVNINGKVHDVCALIFRASLNEAKPTDIIGYYKPYLRDSIIKYLHKIYFPRPAPDAIDTTQHRQQIDRNEFIEALLSISED